MPLLSLSLSSSLSSSLMSSSLLRRAALLLVAASALLAGCATGYKLDNAVQSFSALPVLPANPTYRFERLPSQSADQAAQSQLEALADPALFEAGLRRDDAAPRYAVQVSARAARVLSPWSDPWWGNSAAFGWNLGLGVGVGRHGGVGMSLGYPIFPPAPPWWHREVSVLVRSLANNQVVFESRAVNEGPWHDSNTVLAAMFKAAMNGFPNPPQGLRRVDLQVGGEKR